MKKCFAFISMILILILSGCTQNNGHIGPIFGSWSLIEMTENGLPINMNDETVFSFQNQVVQVIKYQKNPPYVGVIKYGNFTISDDMLTLKFQLKSTEVDNYMYLTPDWLHFPLDGEPIHLDVWKLSGSEMVLSLDNEGKTIGYKFRKTW